MDYVKKSDEGPYPMVEPFFVDTGFDPQNQVEYVRY